MYRIDNATAATTLPAPSAVGSNPNGFFTDGDPAGGIPATIVDDDWLNAVQEELANAITSDGTPLSKTNNAQLTAKLTGRRLGPPIVITSSTTYTWSAGTRLIRVQQVGGGGPGAGSIATDSSHCAACSGGGSSSYVEAWFLVSALSGPVPVTIGAAGTPTPGQGTSGGTSTFGSYISTPGGGGGFANTISATAFGYSGQGIGGQGATVSGALVSLIRNGQSGTNGIGMQGQMIPGIGGWSPLGAGGPNSNPGQPTAASGYGAGGGGAGVGANNPATNGGVATGGVIIIEEFS